MSNEGTMLDIAVAEPGAAGDAEFVDEVTRLVNDVYAVGEEGLWVEGTERTDPAEVAGIIEAGELAVARLDGKPAGVARVQVLPSGEGEFGMLAASFAHRNVGVGRQLVAFAERWAVDRGRETMQLELLMPKDWTHPVKEFLRTWYTRIGYRVVRTGDFASAYPALEPRLATPCDFLVFHRPL